MSDLKIVVQNGKVVTDSRDVAKATEKNHKELLRVIRNYCDVLGKRNIALAEFFIESYYSDSQGKPRPHFFLTKKGCDMVANKMTGEKGILFTAAYVTKFEEIERQLQEVNKPSYMIDDPIKRAEKWIAERKQYEALEEQRRTDELYTTFGKAVSNSKATINVGTFAKMIRDEHGLRIGRNKMFEWLRNHGFLMKNGREFNNPKQKYIDQGWFDTSTTIVSRTVGDVESLTTLITGKGQVKLAEILLNEFKAVI